VEGKPWMALGCDGVLCWADTRYGCMEGVFEGWSGESSKRIIRVRAVSRLPGEWTCCVYSCGWVSRTNLEVKRRFGPLVPEVGPKVSQRWRNSTSLLMSTRRSHVVLLGPAS